MKYILILLFSFSLYGQGTTTCCRVNSVAVEIIGPDSLANECLLCNKIKLSNMDDEIFSANSEASIDTSLERAIKYCKISQTNTIELIIKLIKSNKEILKEKEVHGLGDTLDYINHLINAEIVGNFNNNNVQAALKLEICNDTSKKQKLSKHTQHLIELLKEIKQEYELASTICPSYIQSEKEKKIAKQINSIIKLHQTIKR